MCSIRQRIYRRDASGYEFKRQIAHMTGVNETFFEALLSRVFGVGVAMSQVNSLKKT